MHGHPIVPHAKQRAFLDDGARIVGTAAGSQSGKTLAAAAKFATRLAYTYNRKRLERRGSRILVNAWVVTPTYELARIPQRYLQERWPKRWRYKTAGVYTEVEPWPGCLVKFKSAEHPDKLVSEPVDAMWVNETARIKPDAWRGNLRPRLNATQGWVIWDTTPMGENWVYSDLWIPSMPPGHPLHDPDKYSPEYSAHSWYTEDNPAVTREEIENAKRTLPPAYFDREYRASFSAFHGKVYDQLSKDRHVKPCDVNGYPQTVGGMDFGFGPGHPGVLLICGVDPVRRRVGVLEEHVHEGKTPDQWLEILCGAALRYPQLRYVHADSARPDLMAQMRARQPGVLAGRRRSVDIVPADKEVLAGIMAVAELVYTDALVIDPKCRETIRQMMSYRWAEKKSGMADVPAKADDDCPDALRYLVMGCGLQRTNSRAA